MPEPTQLAFEIAADIPLLRAGTDEVGRGPLAGDVVAAAVILDPQSPIAGLNDSKKLTERALLRAGILQALRKTQFHRDEFDRAWFGLKDEVPFAEPKSRSQSLFLLFAVEEEERHYPNSSKQ